MKQLSYTVFLLVLLHVVYQASGQKLEEKWSVQMSGSGTVFYGDIHQNDFIPVLRNKNELKGSLSICLNRQLNQYFALQAYLTSGSLAGTKRSENKYFKCRFTEYGFTALINVNDVIFTSYRSRSRQFLNFYVMVGWGLMDFRTQVRKLSDNSFIKGQGYNASGDRTKATTEMVIPVGVGVKSRLNRWMKIQGPFFSNTDLLTEFIIKNVNSDKVDDEIDFVTGKDKYFMFNVGLCYHFTPHKIKFIMGFNEIKKTLPVY
ncbi:MAG: hypothetical protein NTU44_10315 [Bacteroidetes bacterium]|nr:hypothetical protein [Bacteroidota bacterium]